MYQKGKQRPLSTVYDRHNINYEGNPRRFLSADPRIGSTISLLFSHAQLTDTAAATKR